VTAVSAERHSSSTASASHGGTASAVPVLFLDSAMIASHGGTASAVPVLFLDSAMIARGHWQFTAVSYHTVQCGADWSSEPSSWYVITGTAL
jgi:hypothetical protein